MTKILVVEYDLDVLQSLVDLLRSHDFLVDESATGCGAIQKLRTGKYDLMVLDWNLPDLSGTALCKFVHATVSNMPILVVTARNDAQARELALRSGANDYLAKPFNVRVFLERVGWLLNQSTILDQEALVAGPLFLNQLEERLIHNGKEIPLEKTEFKLLSMFMRHPQEVLTLDQLLKPIKDCQSLASLEELRQCISRLRKKIDQGQPSFIRNVGQGYRFEITLQKLKPL